jgi:hypothetical protein
MINILYTPKLRIFSLRFANHLSVPLEFELQDRAKLDLKLVFYMVVGSLWPRSQLERPARNFFQVYRNSADLVNTYISAPKQGHELGSLYTGAVLSAQAYRVIPLRNVCLPKLSSVNSSFLNVDSTHRSWGIRSDYRLFSTILPWYLFRIPHHNIFTHYAPIKAIDA